MNKSPVNYILTTAIIGLLWVVCGILMASYLSENPNLADKEPAALAGELQIMFGIGAFLNIICACYWYYYGSQEKTAGELAKAKRKWLMLFVTQIILDIALTCIIIIMNMHQGIEAKWFAIYFGLLAVLTFISFWLTTFLMSPRTVQFIPFGK